MQKNARKMADVVEDIKSLATERKSKTVESETRLDLLMNGKKDVIELHDGINISNGDDGGDSSQEDGYAFSTIFSVASISVKNADRLIKLPEVEKLPPYTTWVFLDRNQRMKEDQSVVGRRRIYYDQIGGEALICSDSEEDNNKEEDKKKEFTEAEDYILQMTVEVWGISDATLDLLAHCFSKTPDDVKARHEDLVGEKNLLSSANNDNVDGFMSAYFDKNLEAALDSFDILFCRRCLVFDCRLHGNSQELIFPAEKQLPLSLPDPENEPCGSNCYRLVLNSEGDPLKKSSGTAICEENVSLPSEAGVQTALMSKKKHLRPSVKGRPKYSQIDSGASSSAKNISESGDSEIRPPTDVASALPPKSKISKGRTQKRNSKKINEHKLVARKERQKKMLAPYYDPDLDNNKLLLTEPSSCLPNHVVDEEIMPSNIESLRKEDLADENMQKKEVNDDDSWKPIEKALYEKGLEIFGRNSCLIARNLMNGLKTCSEIFLYMNSCENKILSQDEDGANALMEGYYKVDGKETTGVGVRRRSRFLRRRGKVRRLKFSRKSAGYQSIRKRISVKKDEVYQQYNPCECQGPCGKECPCLVNGTCCEKYCGCPKNCKNRFRGCHCVKSQCRSLQCPCFAADRECDPDVCRNCWIGCGDGTLGIPSQRGDNYECSNMKLLLKQQQRVLLGPSDVSGWGAFLKNTVGKNDYLGEYTGELISHVEAEKRGKIYDLENVSFLFDLNGQFSLDALRMGNKLKFANHSYNPNCYAKVMMAAGDHRVGIYANKQINAGEELFYNYGYPAHCALAWFKELKASGSKKDGAGPSSGRVKKHKPAWIKELEASGSKKDGAGLSSGRAKKYTPAWVKELEASGSKKDGAGPSSGRAKKRTPAWVKELEASGRKKDGAGPSSGCAKKHAPAGAKELEAFASKKDGAGPSSGRAKKHTPAGAKELEAFASKKDGAGPSSGCAKKHAPAGAKELEAFASEKDGAGPSSGCAKKHAPAGAEELEAFASKKDGAGPPSGCAKKHA